MRAESLNPGGKSYTSDVESDSSETDLHQLLTGDDTLGTERVDQDTCVFLVLVCTVQRVDHHLVQHLWQKMFWGLHLLYSIDGFIDILAVGVIRHQSCLQEQENFSLNRSDTHHVVVVVDKAQRNLRSSCATPLL